MPWCPKCGAEYVENVRKCKDCDVRLLDHKPTPDEMLPPDPKPTGWRRFVTRERFLRVLKTLIAILLALFTKEVYLSLFAGCSLGALLVAEFHPWVAFDTLFNTMIDSVDFSILMFMILLGMVVMLSLIHI